MHGLLGEFVHLASQRCVDFAAFGGEHQADAAAVLFVVLSRDEALLAQIFDELGQLAFVSLHVGDEFGELGTVIACQKTEQATLHVR